MIRKRFPETFASDLVDVLTSWTVAGYAPNTGAIYGPMPLLDRWHVESCAFRNRRRTVVDLVLRRDVHERLHLVLRASELVGPYSRPLTPGEDYGDSDVSLLVNLSGLVQETVVPRRSGSKRRIRLKA